MNIMSNKEKLEKIEVFAHVRRVHIRNKKNNVTKTFVKYFSKRRRMWVWDEIVTDSETNVKLYLSSFKSNKDVFSYLERLSPSWEIETISNVGY